MRPFLPRDVRSLREVVSARIQNRTFRSTLRNLINDIRNNKAPGAAFFLLGYPRLMPENTRGGLRPGECFNLNLVYGSSERRFFRSITEELDVLLAGVAREAGVHNLATRVLTRFDGHETCSLGGEDWINAFLRSPVVESLHPNALGHLEYAKIVADYIDERRRTGGNLLPNGLPQNPAPSGGQTTASRGAGEEQPLPSFGDLSVAPEDPSCDFQEGYVRGQMVRVRGGNFERESSVLVRFRSSNAAEAQALGTIEASSKGAIDQAVTIPLSVPAAGAGLIEALGTRVDGGALLLVKLIELAPSRTVDTDSDGTPDICDNCPQTSNSGQIDSDGDLVGDACDSCPEDNENDRDVDGLCAGADPCPADQENDADGDGLCESLDNCPLVANPDQADADIDGRGDACADTRCFRVSVDVSPPDSGGVAITPPNCRSNEYEAGTIIEFSAVPQRGFTLVGWSGGITGSSNSITASVGADIEAHATFEEPCPGDCDSNNSTSASELVEMIHATLTAGARCPGSDLGRDGLVTITDLVAAVGQAETRCAEPPSPPTPG